MFFRQNDVRDGTTLSSGDIFLGKIIPVTLLYQEFFVLDLYEFTRRIDYKWEAARASTICWTVH